LRRLRNRYRLVILKDYDLAEKASFSIKGANVIAFFSIILVVTFLLFWALFSYTPMVYFLPISNQIQKERELSQLARTTDSLTRVIKQRETYFNNIKTILRGKVPDTTAKAAAAVNKKPEPRETSSGSDGLLSQDTLPNPLDKQGRQGYTLLPTGNPQNSTVPLDQLAFFPPLEGLVTAEYQDTEDHYAVDVVAPADSRIKAVKDGHVIHTGWSTSAGHTIMIQHAFDLISIYKHNSELLENVGSFVKAGDPIGIVGTSGNLSTGPHLHFELWRNGVPVDPQAYISFE
jgi:murein DD-endopeptidase MepM/ murein hydrolase activator NlpD